MATLTEWIKQAQKLVDEGVTKVEEIHKTIVATPYNAVKELVPESVQLKDVQELHEKSFGVVYNTIRAINKQVGEIAEGILKTDAPKAEAAAK